MIIRLTEDPWYQMNPSEVHFRVAVGDEVSLCAITTHALDSDYNIIGGTKNTWLDGFDARKDAILEVAHRKLLTAESVEDGEFRIRITKNG